MRLEFPKAGIGNPEIARQSQVFQRGQALEPGKPLVRDFGEQKIKSLDAAKFFQMFQAGIGDSRSAD